MPVSLAREPKYIFFVFLGAYEWRARLSSFFFPLFTLTFSPPSFPMRRFLLQPTLPPHDLFNFSSALYEVTANGELSSDPHTHLPSGLG